MKLKSLSRTLKEIENLLKDKQNKKQDKPEQKIKIKENPEEVELKRCKELIIKYEKLIKSLIDDIDEYQLEYEVLNNDKPFNGIITLRTLNMIKDTFPKEYEKFEK